MHAQSSSGMQFCNPGACPEAYSGLKTDSSYHFMTQHATRPQANAFPATAAQAATLQSLCTLLGMKQAQQQQEQQERQEHSRKDVMNIPSRAAPMTAKLQPPGLEPCRTWHPALRSESRPVTSAFCQSQATVSPPPPAPQPPHYPPPVPTIPSPPLHHQAQAQTLQSQQTLNRAQQLQDAALTRSSSRYCQSDVAGIMPTQVGFASCAASCAASAVRQPPLPPLHAAPPLQPQPLPLPTSKRPPPTPVECLDDSQTLHKKASSAAVAYRDTRQDQGLSQPACGNLDIACIKPVQGHNSNPREPEHGKNAGPLYTAARHSSNTAAWFVDQQVDTTGHNQPPISTELTIGSQQHDNLLQSDGADNKPQHEQCLWQCYPYCTHGMLLTPCTAPVVSNGLSAGSSDGPRAAAVAHAVAGDTDHGAAASMGVPHAVSSLTVAALDARTQASDNTVGCTAATQFCSSVTPDVHPLMAFLPDLPCELV